MKKLTDKLTDAAVLRQKAEELLKLRTDSLPCVSKEYTDLLKLVLELEVHQVELEMQNEELLKAKEKAELAEEKYTELYDFAPSGYITLSKEGIITELNFSAARMLGKERLHVVTKNFSLFVSAETRPVFNAFFHHVFTGKIKQTCEVVLAADCNLPIYVSINGIVSQKNEFCLLTLNDITENIRSKKELEESEVRFRNLMENIDAVAVQGYGPEGITRFWNKASEKLYGYTRQDAIGKNLLDLIIPSEMKDGVTKAILEMAESGEPIPSAELLLKHKDGSPVPVISHHAIVKLQGHAQELFCFDVDITERKKAEEALRVSEEKLRSIYSVAPAGIGVIENRVLKEGNPHFFDMLGYTREELIEKNARILYPSHEEYEFAGREKYNQIREKGIGKVETVWQKKDGSIINILLASTPVDKNDISKGTIFTALDITERKRAEAALRKSEERFHLAMKASNDGLFDWNLETNDIYYSPGWKKMLGYADDELPNDFSVWEKNTDPEDLKKSWELQQKLIAKQIDRFVMEFKMKHKDGHWVDILAKAEVIFNEQGKAIRMIGTHSDITEGKQAELELITSKLRAEESDRLKSAFLANMSHEIRTPMNGILGFSELLKKPGLTGDQQQEYIMIIEKSGNRMLNIINDIVDISKIEAGLMKLDIKESNINELIEYIYTFFKPEVETKGMKLSFKNTLPAKEAIILTDREKLYAILTNLVKNAIKYSKEGTIELGYERKGKDIEFFVKDTGIGIPKDRQEAIFERFIQADITDKMARQGAGLGLAITNAYVGMLGGKIWVESEEGIGSTFYFTLPYNLKLNSETIDRQPTPSENSEDVRKLKVLIVEDDEVSEILIDSYIKMIGKEILKAKTGIEAVEVCRNNQDIDLVLMDIRMPEMGGYEATQRIREFNKEVIIIAQTACGLTGDKNKAIEAGCTDYIAKPIGQSALHTLIKKYFGK